MTSISIWRNKALCYIRVYVTKEIICKSIDISVFNWSIYESKKNKWKYINDDKRERLLHFYRQKMRSILFNLKTNECFKKLLCTKGFDFEGLPLMKPEEQNIELWEPLLNKIKLKKMRMDSRKEEEEYDGLFSCDKCRKRNTRHVSLQTRSSDEPMTTFIFCKNCDIQWKI